jgi:hypothetical protein
MLRKEYQEKYILKRKKIEAIQEETKNIFYLFEELQKEVDLQDEKVNTIEEIINTVKEDVKITENDIKESNESSKFLNYSTAFLGAGLGSLTLLYNPYLCIGTIIAGGIFGYYSGSYLNKKP